MQDTTNLALIRKHGLAAWDGTMSDAWEAVAEDERRETDICLA